MNRITDLKKPLLGNMFDYAESNQGRVPDYIFNQMCEELELNPDDQVVTVYESVDIEWHRYSSGFWRLLKT